MHIQPREAAMLSEIYFLKLEAAKRAADELSRYENARFVPLAPSIAPDTGTFEFKAKK